MKLKLIHTWKKRKWKKGVKREQELTKAKKLVCSFSSRQALAPFCGCLISLAYPLSRVVCVFVCYCCCCCRLGKQLGCDFVSGRNIFFSFHNSSFYLFLLFLRLEEKSCCTFKALQRRTMPRLEFSKVVRALIGRLFMSVIICSTHQIIFGQNLPTLIHENWEGAGLVG